jgi:hypothetical protein
MTTPRLLRATTASISTFALVSGLWATAAAAGSSHGTVGAPAATTTSSSTTTSSTTTTTTVSTGTTTPPPTTTTTTSSGPVAESLLARSISAANAEPALTWTLSELAEGQSVIEVGNAGRLDGTETIEAHLGNQNWNVALVLVGPRIYVLANIYPLEQIIGLKASKAKSESDTWFYIPSSATYLYDTLAYGLTVQTATGAENLVGTPTILRGQTVMGQPVIGLRQVSPQGVITSTQTVYVRANGVPLPVEVQNSFDGVTESVNFSDWGQAPLAVAPNGAVPFKTSWLLKPLPNF